MSKTNVEEEQGWDISHWDAYNTNDTTTIERHNVDV